MLERIQKWAQGSWKLTGLDKQIELSWLRRDDALILNYRRENVEKGLDEVSFGNM